MHKEVVATAAVVADFMAVVEEAASTVAALVHEVLEAEDLAEVLSAVAQPSHSAGAVVGSAAERGALAEIMEHADSVVVRIAVLLLMVAAGRLAARHIGEVLTAAVTADMVVEHTKGTAVRHLPAGAVLQMPGCDLRTRPEL